MSEPPELVSSSDDEGSWDGSFLDNSAEHSLAASTDDFLSSQGFSTDFFEHGRLGAVRGALPVAGGVGGGAAAPQLEPFSNLRNLQTQLRTLQDQLRSINDAEDMGPYSQGQPDADLWDDVDDEVERAMADLETRGLGGGARGGSLFGPADTLSRLLSHMLGLGPTSDAGGLGGDDRSHTLRMLDLGFPTAVDPRRCAALAAEGIPAGRMVGAQDEAWQRPTHPSLSRLLDIMDSGMGQPQASSLLGSRGSPLGAGAVQARAMPRTAGQQQRSGFMWGGSEDRPGLVDTGPLSSEGDSEAYLTDGDGPPPLGSVVEDTEAYLTDEDGPPVLAYSSSQARPRQRRRRDGPTERLQQQHAHQGGGAANAARDDSLPPLVLEGDASSSSEGSEPEQRPAGRHRRRVRSVHRRSRPLATAATHTSGGRAGDGEEGIPSLLSDGSPTSGSESEDGAAAARDSMSSRGFSTGFFDSTRGFSAEFFTSRAPQRPSGLGGRGRQRSLLAGYDSEPPTLQSETDGSSLGSESGESNSEGEGSRGVAWPGGYTTSLPSVRQPPQPPRRRRDAIFGQLPGLGGRSPRELLEDARPGPGSDGPPGLESEGEGGFEQGSNSGSDSEGASSWPGVVPIEEDEEAAMQEVLAAIRRAWALGAGSSGGGGNQGGQEEGLPSMSFYPLLGTEAAAAAAAALGSSTPPRQLGSQRELLEAAQRLAEVHARVGALDLGERLAAMNAQLTAAESANDVPRPLALDGGPAPQPVSFEDALALERASVPAPAAPPLDCGGAGSSTLGTPEAQVAAGRSCSGAGAAAVATAGEREAAGPGHRPEEAACSSRHAVGGGALLVNTAACEGETHPQSPKSPGARVGPSVVGRVLGAGAGLVRWIVAGTRSRGQADGQDSA